MVYGYLIVALIQGVFGARIFLVRNPFTVFLGVVISFFALIPAIGTGVIWVPASLFLLLDGIFQGSDAGILKGIGLFVYCFIFVGSVDNILRP